MPSLKKNVFFSTLLAASNYIFPLIIYPYISRVLGVSNVGICGFVDGVIQYYCNFSMMGITYLGIREISANKGDIIKLSKAFSSLISLNLLSTIIVFLLLLGSIAIIPAFQEYKSLLFAGAIKLVFNALLIEWFYQGLEDFKFITLRTIVLRSIYVVSVFVCVTKQEDYIIYFYLTCLLTVANAIVNTFYSRRFVKFSLKGIVLRPYVKPFIMLGVYSLLVTMYTTFNTIYLGLSANEEQVGYYTTAIKVHNIILAIFTAFSTVVMPRVANLLSEGKIDEFRSLYNKSISILFAFSFPLMAGCIVFADQIVLWISGAGYEGAVPIMRIILPMIFVVGYEQILIMQMLTPMKKDRAILINSSVGAVVCMLLNIIIVSKLQGIGSAVTWVFSEISVMCMAQYFVGKYTGMAFPIKQFLHYVVISLPLVVVLLILHYYNPLSDYTLFVAAIITLLYYGFYEVRIEKNEVVITLIYKIRERFFSK